MSDLKPRPFHIGTRVRIDDEDCEICEIRFAEDDWIWVAYDDGTRVSHCKKSLVHADDGSPLGEWVPIKDDAGGPAYDYTHSLQVIPVSAVNAIIRGEIEQ